MPIIDFLITIGAVAAIGALLGLAFWCAGFIALWFIEGAVFWINFIFEKDEDDLRGPQ